MVWLFFDEPLSEKLCEALADIFPGTSPFGCSDKEQESRRSRGFFLKEKNNS
jgi:hypothetical protein